MGEPLAGILERGLEQVSLVKAGLARELAWRAALLAEALPLAVARLGRAAAWYSEALPICPS